MKHSERTKFIDKNCLNLSILHKFSSEILNLGSLWDKQVWNEFYKNGFIVLIIKHKFMMWFSFLCFRINEGDDKFEFADELLNSITHLEDKLRHINVLSKEADVGMKYCSAMASNKNLGLITLNVIYHSVIVAESS